MPWQWRIRSYSQGGAFMLETVHGDERSLRDELGAIRACHRTAVITPLTEAARQQWESPEWRASIESLCDMRRHV